MNMQVINNKVMMPILTLFCMILVIIGKIKILTIILAMVCIKTLYYNLVEIKNIKLNIHYILFSLVILQYLLIFRDINTANSLKILKTLLEFLICIASFIFSIKYFIRMHKIYSIAQFSILIYILYILINNILKNRFGINSLYWWFKYITLYMLIYNFMNKSSKEKDKNFNIKYIYIILSVMHSIMWIYSLFGIENVFTLTTVSQTYRFGGIIVHPSTMSVLSSLLLILSIYFKYVCTCYSNRYNNLNIMISLVSLIATYGRIGIIIGMTLSLILYINLSKANKKIYLYINIPLVMILLFLLIMNSPENKYWMLKILSRNSGIKDIISLNGRTEIWGYFLNDIIKKNNIIFGYGFNNISLMITNSGLLFSEYAYSMENAYLNIYMELGIIGLYLFFMIIFSYIYELMYNLKYKKYLKKQLLLNIILMLILLTEGMFVPSFGGLPRIQTFIFISIIMINVTYFSDTNNKIGARVLK